MHNILNYIVQGIALKQHSYKSLRSNEVKVNKNWLPEVLGMMDSKSIKVS